MATNIRALVVDLIEKLGNILSQQSKEFGFIGLFKRVDIYAITGANPWVNNTDPGPH